MEFLADQNGLLYEEVYRNTKDVDDSYDYSPSQGRGTQIRGVTDVNYAGKTSDTITVGRNDVTVSTRHTPATKNKARDFVCTPNQVAFDDFVVGQSYSLQLTVTNVSVGFSTFRVCPVPPQFREAVSVKYEFPSRIPAGLSWPVTVVFTPSRNQDVEQSLSLRTPNGTLTVPFTARTPKASISVVTRELDFGVLAIGESASRTISVRNSGALGESVVLTGEFRELLKETHRHPVTGDERSFLKMDVAETTVYIPPHSEKTIGFTFAPLEECEIKTTISFGLRSSPSGAEALADSTLTVTARSTARPVYVANPEIDFQWCFYGDAYCHPIKIANKSDISAQVLPRIPAALRDVFRCDPETMTVQPGSVYEATLYFTPSENLPEDFSAILEFHVKGQALASSLTVTAGLTTPDFVAETSGLEFGQLFVNEEKLITLPLKNKALIPQRVWAANIPENVKVSPDSVVLLPAETFPFRVSLAGGGEGIVATSLLFRGDYGAKQVVSLAANVISPTLLLSESSLKLPACSVDGQVSAPLVLSNIFSQTREFHFRVSSSFVKVSPSVGVLKPGESIPLTVFLSPLFDVESRQTEQASPAEIVRPTKQKKSSTKTSVFTEEEVLHMREAEERRKVPDFSGWSEVMLGGVKVWRNDALVECVSKSGGSAVEEKSEAVRCSLRCTVREPTVVVRSTTSEQSGAATQIGVSRVGNQTGDTGGQKTKSTRGVKKEAEPQSAKPDELKVAVTDYSTKACVDFGEVCLGGVVRRTVFVRNLSDNATHLETSLPLCSKTFSFPKPPPVELGAQEEDAVPIEFSPHDYGTFSETLRVTSAGTTVTVSLTGRCQETKVTFVLEGRDESEDAGHLEGLPVREIAFPVTLVNGSAEVKAYLKNRSSFPVKAAVTFTDEVEPEYSTCPSTQPFLCNLSKCEVPGDGAYPVSITFAPKRQGRYISHAHVVAGSLSCRVRLVGVATEHLSYLLDCDGETVYDFHGTSRVTPERPRCLGESADFPMRLHFLHREQKTFTIGSVRNGPPLECSVVPWKRTYDAAGWGISSTKFHVPSGGEYQFTISLKEKSGASVELLQQCCFAVVLRSVGEPADERIFYFSCTGP